MSKHVSDLPNSIRPLLRIQELFYSSRIFITQREFGEARENIIIEQKTKCYWRLFCKNKDILIINILKII